MAKGELESAEVLFLKAVDLDPGLIGAYARLVSIYVTSNQLDEAIAKMQEAFEANPEDQAALMLLGTLQHQKGDIAAAEETYEKLLTSNPSFAPAASNLAYIYAERGENLDRAHELAELAREAAPEDPHIADTLGWVLFKRSTYQRAVSLLKESVSGLPNDPEVHYHLGMVYYKLDDKEAAWLALNRALELSSDFPGAEEAREVLAELQKY